VPHIKNAAEWRRNNKHIIDMVRKGEEYPHEEDIEKYVATELHKEKLDGGPIFIIRSGISNPQLLMDTYAGSRAVLSNRAGRPIVVLVIGPWAVLFIESRLILGQY
jgi:hypothetical protein